MADNVSYDSDWSSGSGSVSYSTWSSGSENEEVEEDSDENENKNEEEGNNINGGCGKRVSGTTSGAVTVTVKDRGNSKEKEDDPTTGAEEMIQVARSAVKALEKCHDRLDTFLKLLGGRIGVKHAGVLRFGGYQAGFVPLYVANEHTLLLAKKRTSTTTTRRMSSAGI
jgi:hypothetical protein